MSRLPKVRDHMDTEVHCSGPEDGVLDAVDFLLEHRVTGAPVIDANGRLVGMLSERDCLKLLAKGIDFDVPRGTVADFMTSEITAIPPDMDISMMLLGHVPGQHRSPLPGGRGRKSGRCHHSLRHPESDSGQASQMIVGVPKESFPGERRVAMVPAIVSALAQLKLEVCVESGAGDAAGIVDAAFQEKGARIAKSRDDVFKSEIVILGTRRRRQPGSRQG